MKILYISIFFFYYYGSSIAFKVKAACFKRRPIKPFSYHSKSWIICGTIATRFNVYSKDGVLNR